MRRASPSTCAGDPAGGQEGLAVGVGLIGPSEEPFELGPGDCISYPGDIPHVCEALEPGTTVVMAVEHV